MIKIQKNLLIFSLIITGCVSSQKNDHRASLYLQAGEEKLASGQYPSALSDLLEAQKLAPNNPRVLNALGMVYFAQSQYNYSVQFLEQALDENPSFTEAQNNLGRVYLAIGKYSKAENYISAALKDLTYSTPEKPLTNMGLLYHQKKDYKKAKEYYLKALKANREFCPAYNQYGQTLLQLKDYEGAGLILDRAIRVCLENPEEVHYLSALSYYQMGRRDAAVARLQEVIRLYPTSEFADKARSLLTSIQQDPGKPDQQDKR